MALDLTAMQTEVYARGFQYLNDAGAGVTRVTRWINDALHEIDDMERWPYRAATSTGVSPLTIADLGEIQSVVDTTNQVALEPGLQGQLLEEFGSTSTTGTAMYFFMVAGAITAYPVTGNTLSVTYWKVGPDLSAGADTPLMPDRFRMAIVERACAKAYRDQDDPQMAGVCLAESDRIVDRMREVYVLQTGASRVAVFGYSGDF